MVAFCLKCLSYGCPRIGQMSPDRTGRTLALVLVLAAALEECFNAEFPRERCCGSDPDPGCWAYSQFVEEDVLVEYAVQKVRAYCCSPMYGPAVGPHEALPWEIAERKLASLRGALEACVLSAVIPDACNGTNLSCSPLARIDTSPRRAETLWRGSRMMQTSAATRAAR